jgi:hypothetical protein
MIQSSLRDLRNYQITFPNLKRLGYCQFLPSGEESDTLRRIPGAIGLTTACFQMTKIEMLPAVVEARASLLVLSVPASLLDWLVQSIVPAEKSQGAG